MSLSPRQKNILDFIRKFVQENGYPPTIREIGRAANITSTSVVNYNLNILQAKGYIQRDREISRGVKLVERGVLEQDFVSDRDVFKVPVVGRIVAGEPVPIPDETFSPLDVDESIALTRDIVQESGPIYALQVKGDSLIDALIYDGDIVIMKAQKEAKDGDLVAAWLKTEKETTLKRFYRESKNLVRLQPANPSVDPIYVHPANLEIQGKVIAVIRQV
ncbi:MAG: transcriptional repressor LexA [Anaerolineae bacterium]